MHARYELTPEAEENITEILIFVEDEFGTTVADRVYEDLLKAFRIFGDHPEIGRGRTELWSAP